MAKIYLSYSHKDREFARKLTADLRAAGVEVWVDESELKIGDSFVEKMRKGIEEADFLAILISPNSIGSSWVQQELELALSRDDLRVLPLLIGDCELPRELSNRLYADFRKPLLYQKSLEQVLSAVGAGTSGQPAKGREGSPAPGPPRSSGSAYGPPPGRPGTAPAPAPAGLSGTTYAVIALVGLVFGIGLLIFYTGKARDLASSGVNQQVFYLLLIPWALASAAFLFGAMRSYAQFTGKSAGYNLEIAGPVVIFCLVLAGGFKLVPQAADSFDMTVRAHSQDGTAPTITSGSVTIDLENDRRTARFNAEGEAEFKGIPARFRGAAVKILPKVDGYESVWQDGKLEGRAIDIPLRTASPVVKFQGTLLPVPSSPEAIRIVAVGQKGEAIPDRFGRFALDVGGRAGDQVRIRVFSGQKVIYDDYQTLPGPGTITTRRP